MDSRAIETPPGATETRLGFAGLRLAGHGRGPGAGETTDGGPKREMALAGAGGGRKCAHEGRPAGSEPAFEVRASPEMRPGSHDDWAATPQASLSHP